MSNNRSNPFKIVAIKTTKNPSQFQMECSQLVNTSEAESMSEAQLLGFLQEGNTKVNTPKERRIWKNVTAQFLMKVGIDVTKLSFDPTTMSASVDIVEPMVNGMYLNIQIVEATESELSNHSNDTDVAYKLANKQTTAKRVLTKDKTEYLYFQKNGELVFSFGKLSANKDPEAKAEHILIKDAVKVTETSLFGVASKITNIVTE